MTPRKASEGIFAGSVLRAQPDRRLVTLAREGHGTAVDEIVRRYRPALLRYAASIVPPDRADDVVQDSLARALPAIESGDAELHLRPWLYTIVRNAAFNDLRDAGPPWEQLDENYDGVEQPPQALERREQVRSLLVNLRGLPETQRQALVKREMEGRSHAEIGADLGISGGAARQLIYRARAALREGLGALVPMPLLRQLVEGSGASDGVTAAGSGVVVAKATIALLATGAVVTAGIAIKDSNRQRAQSTAGVAKGIGTTEAPIASGQGSGRRSQLTAFAGGGGGSTQARPPFDGGGRSHVSTGAAEPTSGAGGRGGPRAVDTQGGTGRGEGEHQGSSLSGDSGSGDSLSGPDANSGSTDGEQSANDGQSGSGTNDGSGDTTDTGDSSGGDAATAGSHDGPGSGDPSTLLLGSD